MKHDDFYRGIIENSPVGYLYAKIIYDHQEMPQDYVILEVNKAYKEMTDIAEKELIGKRLSQVYDAIKKSTITWKDFHNHSRDKYKREESDGYFNFNEKSYRIKTFSPQKDHIAVYLTDISDEMKKTKKLNIISDHVSSQIWYLKDPMTYVSANSVHADFLGLKKEELESRDITDLFSKEEVKTCSQGNEKVFHEKRPIHTKQWLKDGEGKERLLRIKKDPKLDSQGQVEYVVCTAEDLTDEYMSKEQNMIKESLLYSTMAFTQELLTNENIAKALSNGIEMLGNATQVDRVYYWENHYDEEAEKWLTSQKIEWCLGDIDQQSDNPELQNVPFDEVGDFIGTLSQNKTFNAHVKDLDDNADSSKSSFQAQGILSILVIPVFVRDEFKGFIGFDSCKYEKEWSQVEISLLKSFVLLYAKAWERKFLEESAIQSKVNFSNFFNTIDALLFVLDFDGKIIDINNNVLKKFNYSEEELLGRPVSILHPKEKMGEVKKNIDDLVMKKIESCNLSAITKDGHIFPVETRVSEGVWNGKKVIFAVSKDISQLVLSEEKFSKAFNNNGVSMLISKFKDGQILEVNDRYLDFLGYKRNEIIGKYTTDFKIVSEFGNRKMIKEELRRHGKITDMEISITGKDNIKRVGLANSTPLNINGEKCLITSIIDISERFKYEQKMLELSNIDHLTGVYNRRCFYNRAETILAEYKRNQTIFSLAIIDIDNFKKINDDHGHQAGDCALKEFANLIKSNLRLYDILGRYGGEEFIIILNHADKEESKTILKRILTIVSEKIFLYHNKNIRLTFSGGISSCKEFKKDVTIDELVGLADQRMYQAKNDGKNGIVYEDIMVAGHQKNMLEG